MARRWRDRGSESAKAWLPPDLVVAVARIAPPADLMRPSEPHWSEPHLDRALPIDAIRREIRYLPIVARWTRLPPAEVLRALQAAARLDARRPDGPLAPSPNRWCAYRVAVFADQPAPVQTSIRTAVDAGLLPLLPGWREQLAA